MAQTLTEIVKKYKNIIERNSLFVINLKDNYSTNIREVKTFSDGSITVFLDNPYAKDIDDPAIIESYDQEEPVWEINYFDSIQNELANNTFVNLLNNSYQISKDKLSEIKYIVNSNDTSELKLKRIEQICEETKMKTTNYYINSVETEGSRKCIIETCREDEKNIYYTFSYEKDCPIEVTTPKESLPKEDIKNLQPGKFIYVTKTEK